MPHPSLYLINPGGDSPNLLVKILCPAARVVVGCRTRALVDRRGDDIESPSVLAPTIGSLLEARVRYQIRGGAREERDKEKGQKGKQKNEQTASQRVCHSRKSLDQPAGGFLYREIALSRAKMASSSRARALRVRAL